MIIVIGTALVQSGKEAQALKLSLEHVQRSRLESGCISHDVSTDAKNPSKLVFVEYWKDLPALMTHFSLKASKGFVRDLTPMLSQAPDMKIFKAEEVKLGS